MASRKRVAGRKQAKKPANQRARKTTKKAAGKATKKSAARPAKKATRKGARKASAKSATKTSKTAARKPSASTRPVTPVHTAAALRAIVERYVAAYNARDKESILALYDRRATMEDPLGLPPAVGLAEIGALYQMGFDMGVSIAPDGAVRCAGNSVAFPLIASSPSSKLEVIDVFDFGRNGKIVQMRAYWGPDNLVGDLAVRQ